MYDFKEKQNKWYAMILTNKKQQNKTFIQIYNPLKDDEKGHCKIYVKEQSIPFQIGWKMKKKKDLIISAVQSNC